MQKVAAHCTNAAFWNMSENCSCGSRLLVHESVKDRLLALMLKQLDEKWIIGDPTDPNVMVGALIEKTHLEKVLRYIEEGKKSGAKLIRGGNRVRAGRQNKISAFFFFFFFLDCFSLS